MLAKAAIQHQCGQAAKAGRRGHRVCFLVLQATLELRQVQGRPLLPAKEPQDYAVCPVSLGWLLLRGISLGCHPLLLMLGPQHHVLRHFCLTRLISNFQAHFRLRILDLCLYKQMFLRMPPKVRTPLSHGSSLLRKGSHNRFWLLSLSHTSCRLFPESQRARELLRRLCSSTRQHPPSQISSRRGRWLLSIERAAAPRAFVALVF